MNEFALEISELIGLVKGPFPYPDSRVIKALHPKFAPDLIPDLDMYFYEVSSVAGALLIPPTDPLRLRELRRYVSKSFLEQHPHGSEAIASATAERTPKLHAWLHIHERLRQISLAILDDLESADSNRARSSG